MDPWIGQVVNGKFRVEALVGQGGMGRVYRAKHLTLDRPVVLKMLHKDFSTDPQVVQRFQREARAASRLNHPNSIAVLDFGEAEDGTLFMAMEFLAGRDLARVIGDEFPLGDARIVRIGAQMLSALAEAHVQGIVHRDLKPENVMIEPRRGEPDFVKVLDFGIAKITSPGANEPKLTQAGLVCGTPEYMSPEQARGAELDSRTDLYSTGVILYQMATGELPFQSDTPVGFLTKHLTETAGPGARALGRRVGGARGGHLPRDGEGSRPPLPDRGRDARRAPRRRSGGRDRAAAAPSRAVPVAATPPATPRAGRPPRAGCGRRRSRRDGGRRAAAGARGRSSGCSRRWSWSRASAAGAVDVPRAAERRRPEGVHRTSISPAQAAAASPAAPAPAPAPPPPTERRPRPRRRPRRLRRPSRRGRPLPDPPVIAAPTPAPEVAAGEGDTRPRRRSPPPRPRSATRPRRSRSTRRAEARRSATRTSTARSSSTSRPRRPTRTSPTCRRSSRSATS